MSDQVEMEQEENKETMPVTTEKSSTEKKRFEVKKWNAVALWAWGDFFVKSFTWPQLVYSLFDSL
jgi:hypothetical protein